MYFREFLTIFDTERPLIDIWIITVAGHCCPESPRGTRAPLSHVDHALVTLAVVIALRAALYAFDTIRVDVIASSGGAHFATRTATVRREVVLISQKVALAVNKVPRIDIAAQTIRVRAVGVLNNAVVIPRSIKEGVVFKGS